MACYVSIKGGSPHIAKEADCLEADFKCLFPSNVLKNVQICLIQNSKFKEHPYTLHLESPINSLLYLLFLSPSL